MVRHMSPLGAVAVACAGALLRADRVAALPLCDDSIVKETCELVGEPRSGTTSKSDVQELTSATPEQASELWSTLGLTEDRVDCSTLCFTLVGFLSQDGSLPTESDNACYEVDGTDGDIRCDLDLRQPNPDGGGPGAPRDDEDEDDRGHRGPTRHNHGHQGHRDGHDADLVYSMRELALKVANLYRIFPALDPSFESDDEAVASPSAARRLASQEDWKSVVARVSTVASADIAHAIRHIRDKRAEKYLTKWFGKYATDQPYTRKELLRVMNSAMHVMANAVYSFGDADCDPETYAYVWPTGRQSKDKDGKFRVFLCELWLTDKRAQRETLTHEASHHASAYTDDVCYKSLQHVHKQKRNLKVLKYRSELNDPDPEIGDIVEVHWGGQVYDGEVMQVRDNDEVILNIEPFDDCDDLAYGRRTCIDLARRSPIKALRNADSFCYFIQDMTDYLT